MNSIETYNIKERFPVGDKGVMLLEYPTPPKRFAICLYDQSNPDALYGRIPETSEQAAYRIYLERCDTLVEQLEQKTELQFPLPFSCMAVLTSTGDLVNIRRGMTGYYPSDWNVPGDRKRNEDIAAFNNAQHELTKAQCAAMVCGSMFGWDVPGANPAIYDENGQFKSSSRLLDARMEEFDCIELFDHPALFHNCRIDPATVPAGIYRYEVRDDGENGYACEIAKHIAVNHMGTILTDQPVPLNEDGCYLLGEYDLNFAPGGQMTLKDYMNRSHEQTKDNIER
jgi:hypothetical protein